MPTYVGANYPTQTEAKFIWKSAFISLDMGQLQYVCLPVSMGIFAIFLPSKPPLLSALFCQNEDCNFAIRFILIIIETTNMAVAADGSGYHGLVLLIPSITFILSDLKYLKTGISGYRKLQVLEKIVNSVIRDRIFATYGYFLPFVQLSLCFMAIKIWQSPDANIARMAIFVSPYLGLLTFTMVAFSVAGNVIRISAEWILRFKGKNKSAFKRRVCRSLAPLRIQFGNNFVEQLTPLVIQEFCIRQTASLLLVWK